MRNLIIVLSCLGLVGCANLQKKIVDPQGRSEQQKFSDGEICHKYARKMSCFRNQCDTQFVTYFDACMENNGYKFEYVAEKSPE